MGTRTTLCVFVVLLSSALANNTDSLDLQAIIARLARVESDLATVLRKNAELETRVVALEDENRRLKSTNTATQDCGDSKPATAEHEGVTDVDGTGGLSTPGDQTVAEQSAGGERQAAPSARGIQRRHGGAPRLLVTADPTVAFTATISPAFIGNLGAGQAIVYDRIITNMGGAYHSTTGVFTAPVSGVYVFSVETMVNPNTRQYLELALNAAEVIPIYSHGTGENRFESSCRLATLKLKVGDEVWVRTYNSSNHGDGIVHGYNFSSFSGWIVTIIE